MFSNDLYNYSEEIWLGYNNQPFVDELGSGKLDIEKFRFYMIQDYLYLLEYSKVFSLGAIKSLDEENMKIFSQLAESILNTEMSIHKNYMNKLGITSDDILLAKPSLSNLSYTHYMLAVSHSGDILDISVAVLSCLWSYKLIAEHLFNKYGIQDNFYAEWIEGYISKEYAELNTWLLNLVNKLASEVSSGKKERLNEIFYNCSRFEKMFWDMSYNLEM